MDGLRSAGGVEENRARVPRSRPISETKYARAVTTKLQEYEDKGDLKSAPIKEQHLANFARYCYTRLYAVPGKNRDRLVKWCNENADSIRSWGDLGGFLNTKAEDALLGIHNPPKPSTPPEEADRDGRSASPPGSVLAPGPVSAPGAVLPSGFVFPPGLVFPPSPTPGQYEQLAVSPSEADEINQQQQQHGADPQHFGGYGPTTVETLEFHHSSLHSELDRLKQTFAYDGQMKLAFEMTMAPQIAAMVSEAARMMANFHVEAQNGRYAAEGQAQGQQGPGFGPPPEFGPSEIINDGATGATGGQLSQEQVQPIPGVDNVDFEFESVLKSMLQ